MHLIKNCLDLFEFARASYPFVGLGGCRAISVNSAATAVVGAFVMVLAPNPAKAADVREPTTLLGLAPPFTPRKTDYSLELGWMRHREDLVSLGANIGFHVGRCIFTQSQTCQQYIDLIGSTGLRESESYGLFLGSVRWQYVNVPDRYSPFWRLYGGAGRVQNPFEIGWRPVFGAGVGVTTYLHDKVDLRLEARTGVIDRGFVQVVVGVQIKTDRLLAVFAKKLRDLGYETFETAFEATETTIEATGEGLGGIVEGVASPFTKEHGKVRKSKDEQSKDEKLKDQKAKDQAPQEQVPKDQNQQSKPDGK